MKALHDWTALSFAVALFFCLQGVFWLLRGRSRRRDDQLRDRLVGGRLDHQLDGGRIRIRERPEARNRSLRRRLTELLLRAGVSLSPQQFFARSLLGLALLVLLAVAVSGELLAGLAALVAGVICGYAYLAHRIERQIRQVESQMPRALEMMVFGLRAGHAFEEVIALATREISGPLATELSRCHEEYTLGRPIEESLQQLRVRWPTVMSLRQLVEAIVVLKRTGGNLVDILEKVGETVRAQATYEAKHRALTSEGRLSGTILMLLPLFALLFQAVAAPDQLALLARDPAGQTMLLLAVGLWSTGVLWVLRLVRPRGTMR